MVDRRCNGLLYREGDTASALVSNPRHWHRHGSMCAVPMIVAASSGLVLGVMGASNVNSLTPARKHRPLWRTMLLSAVRQEAVLGGGRRTAAMVKKDVARGGERRGDA
jgi:hypothetical protein